MATKRQTGYPPKVKKGALHKELHVAAGKKLGMAKLEATKRKAKKAGNVKLEKRAIFAINFNHGRKPKKGEVKNAPHFTRG